MLVTLTRYHGKTYSDVLEIWDRADVQISTFNPGCKSKTFTVITEITDGMLDSLRMHGIDKSYVKYDFYVYARHGL